MLSFLNNPYPLSDTSIKHLKVAFLFSVFIFLFLYIFKPFGLGNPDLEINPLLICAGYGFVTFIILLLNAFLLPVIFKKSYSEKNWKVHNEILEMLWYFFSIGTGNFIYSALLWNSRLTISGFISLQFFTLITGAIPVTVLVLLKQIRWLKKYADEAHEISKSIKLPSANLGENSAISYPDQPIRLVADNGKDFFEILSQKLIYIQAAGNYIEVYYEKDNLLKKTLLRCTLKRTQEILKAKNDFFRCHRLYIVNLQRVRNVSGNSQGLKLHLKGVNDLIPVSRSLDAELSKRIAEI